MANPVDGKNNGPGPGPAANLREIPGSKEAMAFVARHFNGMKRESMVQMIKAVDSVLAFKAKLPPPQEDEK